MDDARQKKEQKRKHMALTDGANEATHPTPEARHWPLALTEKVDVDNDIFFSFIISRPFSYSKAPSAS